MSEFDLWQRRCDGALESLSNAMWERDQARNQVAAVVALCNRSSGLLSKDMVLMTLSVAGAEGPGKPFRT